MTSTADAGSSVASSEGLMMKGRPIVLAWCLACILVLAWWVYTYFRSDLTDVLKTESQMYVLLGMVLLTFPSGLVWLVLFSFVLGTLDYFGIPSRPLLLEVSVMWAGFVAVGFLQWFVYGPKMLARFRNWRSPRRAE